MITITLTKEELKECLQAVQENREINDNEIVNVQMTKDDYTLNITTKDGELVLLNIAPKDGELVLFNVAPKVRELVLFNIITKEGKLLFEEEVIFIFILNGVIKAGRKNGEVIEIDNILASK